MPVAGMRCTSILMRRGWATCEVLSLQDYLRVFLALFLDEGGLTLDNYITKIGNPKARGHRAYTQSACSHIHGA